MGHGELQDAEQASSMDVAAEDSARQPKLQEGWASEPPALVNRLAMLRSKLRGVPVEDDDMLQGQETVEKLLAESRANKEVKPIGGRAAHGSAPDVSQGSLAAIMEAATASPLNVRRVDSSAPVVVTGVRTREETDAEGRVVYALDKDSGELSPLKRDQHGGSSLSLSSLSQGGGGGSGSVPPDASAVAGLADVLEACNLSEHLAVALAWCDAQGVDSISMLREVEMDGELVAALNLKPAKAKQLSKRLGEWVPSPAYSLKRRMTEAPPADGCVRARH